MFGLEAYLPYQRYHAWALLSNNVQDKRKIPILPAKNPVLEISWDHDETISQDPNKFVSWDSKVALSLTQQTGAISIASMSR